ncbi:FAR1-related protein [Sesbania bispinosa]|nr:FAR1-related protein [Sesbania bispinosa]
MVAQFKRCMLGDYELHKFHRKWDNMVKEFGLEENSWVKEIYEKRKMWATTYLRGEFFAGFRTTSRCEENYRRCVQAFRYRELESDFNSVHGEPVMQTNIQSLERYACRLFTREVVALFLPPNPQSQGNVKGARFVERLAITEQHVQGGGCRNKNHQTLF